MSLRYVLIVLSIIVLGASAAIAATNVAGRVKSGTGFAVSPLGHIITSAHVVAGCRTVSVWGQDRARRVARIIAKDAVHDIALLRVSGTLLSYAHAPSLRQLALGEQVLALGYGVHIEDPRSPEEATGIYVGNSLTATGIRVYVFHARLRPGDSGSAVVATDGALFGMVIGRDTDSPDLGLVLPVPEIERFLGRHGVQLFPTTAVDVWEASGLLLAISNLVQCELKL
jgi:S1-C subfamily serine protease